MAKRIVRHSAKAAAVRRAGLDPREGHDGGTARFARKGPKGRWWVEIPMGLIAPIGGRPHVDLLLQDGEVLHHLRVPASFLRQQEFHVRKKGRKDTAFDLVLSDGFKDTRTARRLRLDGFLVRTTRAIKEGEASHSISVGLNRRAGGDAVEMNVGASGKSDDVRCVQVSKSGADALAKALLTAASAAKREGRMWVAMREGEDASRHLSVKKVNRDTVEMRVGSAKGEGVARYVRLTPAGARSLVNALLAVAAQASDNATSPVLAAP